MSTCLPPGSVKSADFFKSGAALCLLAAQAGNPNAIAGDRLEERLHLAQLAALVGRGLVEKAVLGLLLGYGFRRQQIDQIQLPFAGDAVAIGIGLGKVIAGIEKENGNAARSNSMASLASRTSSA